MWGNRRQWDKREIHLGEGEKYYLLQGSQASPACPSDRGSVKGKTGYAEFRFYELTVNCISWKYNFVTFIASVV
jgi:hypothetical protein